MQLYIFNSDIEFQGILEGYFSLIWTRRYSKAGKFELHCGLTPDSISLLKRGNIVAKNNGEAGYIKHRHLEQDKESKETITVKGDFLAGYLGRRIVWGTENLYMTAEMTIRELIDKHAINPTDSDRAIPLLELGEAKGIPGTIRTQTSYRNLLDCISQIATGNGLGFKTSLDINNQKIVFDIYEGKDRTAGQSDNPPAIFSREFENILEQEFIDSLDNYRNIALVAGEGEGEERELVTVGEGEGLGRFEEFVDARDLQQEEMSDPEYQEVLETRGQDKIAEKQELQTFESKINPDSNLIYKTDFDLGDKVTCTSRKWGITIDTRITEIEEIYEQSGFELNITFGNNIPTLIDRIKQEVRA